MSWTTNVVEELKPVTQPHIMVNGFKIRVDNDEEPGSVCLSDVAKAVKKSGQYLRGEIGAKKVGDCLPDGRRTGRPSGLYALQDVLSLLAIGRRRGWENAADLIERLA